MLFLTYGGEKHIRQTHKMGEHQVANRTIVFPAKLMDPAKLASRYPTEFVQWWGKLCFHAFTYTHTHTYVCSAGSSIIRVESGG